MVSDHIIKSQHLRKNHEGTHFEIFYDRKLTGLFRGCNIITKQNGKLNC